MISPMDAVARCRDLLLDQLGCQLIGATMPWNQPVYRFVKDNKGVGPARIVKHGDPVPVAIKLREKVQPAEIKSLVVESYKRLLGRGATDAEKWAPRSRETADHSVPFCVAVALLDGALTSRTFDSERFLDKDVIDLMARISLREDPVFTKQYPAKWNCRLVAETVTGAP